MEREHAESGAILRARHRFATLVGTGKPEPPLAETALVVACEEYPKLHPRPYLARLHAFGSVVSERLRADWPGIPLYQIPVEARLDGVRHYLFEELGFRGNEGEYYDPRNSFLNDVIDRRLGIPITLSLVFLEVAAATGLKMTGIGFPGHFLVRTRGVRPAVFLDPFAQGAEVPVNDLRKQLVDGGHSFESVVSILRGARPRDIIRRLLANLKAIYLQTGDFARAVGTAERLLLLDPRAAFELRDLGLAWGKLGRYEKGIAAYEGYLRADPDAGDRADVERNLADLRYWRSRLN
jgi:regulator of sirC expression with transglutaminase-like and TPR domain